VNARFVLLIAACGAALLTTACGGGSHAVLPSNAPHSAQPMAGSIIIHVPSASSATTSTRRSINYVSPSSFSAKIDIAPAQGCTQCTPAQTLQVSLIAASACVTSGSGRTCTIGLNLLAGSYTGSMTVFDGVLTGGQVSGKSLSENTSFPIAIAASALNVTNVTLDGVPVTLVATILTPSALVIDTVHPGIPVYRLVGSGASAQFSIVAKDADGNIIAGPGAPAWTANASGAGFTASVTGNTITLTAPVAVSRQTGSLTMSAVSSGCNDSTAHCALGVQIGFAELLAVVDHGFPKVSVWPIGASAPLASITVPAGPSAVAFAPNGTMFVANAIANTVTAFAPPYTGSPTTISAAISDPVSVAVDGSGNLAVANGTGNVTIYPPPYTTATPTALLAVHPVAVLTDGANHLFVLVGGNNPGGLYRYTAPFTPGGFDFAFNITGSNGVQGMTLDALGRLYVADSGNNDILRLDPPFSSGTPALTIPSTAAQPLSAPQSVAVGPDGTIFTAGGHFVNIYSATGAALGTAGFFGGFATQNAFAVDVDGTVWVATAPVLGLTQPYDVNTFTELSQSGFLTPNALAVWP
jgi:hypothetical protein